jgi:hypothetical protein
MVPGEVGLRNVDEHDPVVIVNEKIRPVTKRVNTKESRPVLPTRR